MLYPGYYSMFSGKLMPLTRIETAKNSGYLFFSYTCRLSQFFYLFFLYTRPPSLFFYFAKHCSIKLESVEMSCVISVRSRWLSLNNSLFFMFFFIFFLFSLISTLPTIIADFLPFRLRIFISLKFKR